jgi:hypothetical protein
MSQLLPTDVINIILEYTGHHKCRNGKYMTQIDKISKKYRPIKRLFRRIVRDGYGKGFAVLHVSPITMYVVFDSYNSGLNRL